MRLPFPFGNMNAWCFFSKILNILSEKNDQSNSLKVLMKCIMLAK